MSNTLHVRCSVKALSKGRTVRILLSAYDHFYPAPDRAIRKIVTIKGVKLQPVGHYCQCIGRDSAYLPIVDLAEGGGTFRIIAKRENKVPFYRASGLKPSEDSHAATVRRGDREREIRNRSFTGCQKKCRPQSRLSNHPF